MIRTSCRADSGAREDSSVEDGDAPLVAAARAVARAVRGPRAALAATAPARALASAAR